jgi:hypothetical protein
MTSINVKYFEACSVQALHRAPPDQKEGGYGRDEQKGRSVHLSELDDDEGGRLWGRQLRQCQAWRRWPGSRVRDGAIGVRGQRHRAQSRMLIGHGGAGGVGCHQEEESGMATERRRGGAGSVDDNRGTTRRWWPKRRWARGRGGAGRGASGVVATVVHQQILVA